MACAKLQEAFYGCTVRPLLIDEPMSRHTSFKIGGPADLLATPSNEEELCKLLARAKEHNIPVTLVGNGSNLLVRDKGIRGLVIKLGNMLNTIEVGEDSITFGSGVSLALASKKAAELGFKIMQFNAVVAANHPALHLYEKLGFVRLGTIPGGFHMKDGHYEDIVLFYHTL